MIRRLCSAFLLACTLPAWAQAQVQTQDWLTISGFPEIEGSDVIQISPVLNTWQQQVTLEVRVTRQATRDGYGKVPFRSFQGMAAVDCTEHKGWYMTIKYFDKPAWAGEPIKIASFKPDEAPMRFRDIPGAPAERIVRAACSASPASAPAPAPAR